MRRIALILAAAVIATPACGGGSAEPVPSETEEVATPTVASPTMGTTARPAAAAPDEGDAGEPAADDTPVPVDQPLPEGEPAADFTLALGDGSTYTLSEGAKPVYLVFWAEW